MLTTDLEVSAFDDTCWAKVDKHFEIHESGRDEKFQDGFDDKHQFNYHYDDVTKNPLDASFLNSLPKVYL